MTNAERIQASNAELRECIEIAESLPDDGYKAGYENLVKFIDGTAGDDFYGEGITHVREYAFYRVPFKTITMPDVTSLSYRAFSYAMNATSISIPNYTGSMGQYMCAQNENLEHFYAPLVTGTEGYVFQDCKKLTMVDFPLLDRVHAGLFQRCSELITVILRYNGVCPLVLTTAFQGTPIESGTGYVYVPSALVESYKTATNWTTYANQFRAIEDYPEICGVTS